MDPSKLHRPIGFHPSEISALINQDVVAQHAEEAAFLWIMRNEAVRAPHYTLKDLAKLDERVEAHLDGLRVADNSGCDDVRKCPRATSARRSVCGR